MTTKYKIICGFVIMVVLQASIAALAYFDIEKASAGFAEYRRLARFNVNASDLKASLNLAVAKTYAFMDSSDKEILAEGVQQCAVFSDLLADTEQWVVNREDADALKEMRTQIDRLKQAQLAIRDSFLEMDKQYVEVVAPNGQHIGKQLDDLAQTAQSIGNAPALYSTEKVWSTYGPMLAALSYFSESRAEEDANVVKENLEASVTALTRLNDELQTEQGRRIYASLMENFAELRQAFEGLRANADTVRQNLAAAQEVAQALTKKLVGFNNTIDTAMRERGSLNLDSNAAAQRNLMILSVVGVIVGIVLAGFIIIGIVRVLSDLAGFASAVAAGNFAAQIRTREKGEIGNMVTAMRKIPAVLDEIVGTAQGLCSSVRVGRLRERLNPANFNGSFGKLAVAINTLGDFLCGCY